MAPVNGAVGQRTRASRAANAQRHTTRLLTYVAEHARAEHGRKGAVLEKKTTVERRNVMVGPLSNAQGVAPGMRRAYRKRVVRLCGAARGSGGSANVVVGVVVQASGAAAKKAGVRSAGVRVRGTRAARAARCGQAV